MNLFFSYLAVLLFSYLYGSIPFSLIFSRLLKGVDVRQEGSGNVGATNVLVTSGKRAAAFAALFDISKGFLAVIAARFLIGGGMPEMLAGIMAVVGHDFPVYLNFKGGKGISSTAGAIIAMDPYAFALCLLCYLVFLALTRYLILSSLLTVASVLFLFYFLKDSLWCVAFAAAALALALYAHREDISRLASGNEARLGASIERVV
ncbi:MAG TPA: glycerol-3-phosphate 1-O-acyltransferase PlsY [Candidatus Omnitrophota bacterium]|nr:glycerol-3-phosphate 1-O-acyltransferase PlsY [Candidatus Omnitrophota bacterium]